MQRGKIDTSPLLPNEYALLLEYFQEREELHWECLCRFLWETGLRISEALAVRLTDLSTRTNRRGHHETVVQVQRLKKRKGPRTDKIPLTEDLAELMRRVARGRHKYVFANKRGKPYTRMAVWKALRRAADAKGVQLEVHPHSFRHGFGRRVARMNLDLSALDHRVLLAGLLGHESIKTVEPYFGAGVEDVDEVWERIHDLSGDSGGPRSRIPGPPGR
ncbi:MAG: tyrosine-type recombinase/integrase [Anaerolineae bacterium]|nr:tyrosine-type recombinase/integrase [Anaerolineae bacterium]